VKGTPLVAAHHKSMSAQKSSVLRMHLDGANPAPDIAGTNLLPGKVNYFMGNDPKKWHTDIPSYEAVRYRGIYPGVDVLFYGREQRLEYDFIVAPGADPSVIALSVAGARKLELNSHGDVVMSVGGGKVALRKPSIYQDVNGQRREIAGNYVLAGDRQIRFSVTAYDHTQPLTIDPLLNYSTYLGGSNFDQAFGIALDAAGDAYITGDTFSTDFPPGTLTAPPDIALGAIFVAELNPTGTSLLYSAYLGGSGNGAFGDGSTAIAVDAASPPNIYVTGFTGSPDFPLSTAPNPLPYQGLPAPASAANGGAAFITKLNPAASGSAQFAYSSYLGGDTFDEGFGIAVDSSGIAYIAGATASTDYPTIGTQLSAGLTSPDGNAFLTKINTTLSGTPSLVYSTYLGGSGTASNFLGFADVAYGLAIDSSANAYLVGGTVSSDFPVAGTAIPSSLACGANTVSSVFISKINTTAQSLTYSHCLTGSTYDLAFGVNLGKGVPPVAGGIVYLTGTTASADFPVTTNSIPPPGPGVNVGNGVAFVSLLNTATGTLQYSTFLGGINSDTGYGISSDSSGNAYVTGQTASTDFPITQGALLETRANSTGAGFVSKINPAGNGLADLVYSTYYGGQAANNLPNQDSGRGIAVSGTNAYVTGQMTSPDMPVSATAYQSALGGSGATNAYIADLPLTPTISVVPSSLNFGTQLVATTSSAMFVTLMNNTSSSVVLTLPATIIGTNPAEFAVANGTCASPLAAGASCTVGATFTPAAATGYSAILDIPDALDPGHDIMVPLTGTGSNTAAAIGFSPASLTFAGQLLTTTSAGQTLTVSNPSTTTALTISAIAVSSDYTIASNSCGNTPITIAAAPGGTPCMLSVTFNPGAATAPGADNGTITFTDNANGSPQSFTLNGTAWDFSVTAGTTSVASGAMGTFPVTITGLGGFTGAVSFTCTPGTLISACAVPTTNAAAAPGATATGTLTASSFIVPPESMKVPPPASPQQLFLLMLALAVLFMIPTTRRFRTRLGMAAAMLVFIVVAGCTGNRPKTKTGSLMITPSSGGVTKSAITVTVTITK
ncbi:MAG: choice-of-anchor D domain-containing protein, partial [Candidatus Acidiferrales bacterium]